jgi:hypothetical protein
MYTKRNDIVILKPEQNKKKKKKALSLEINIFCFFHYRTHYLN